MENNEIVEENEISETNETSENLEQEVLTRLDQVIYYQEEQSRLSLQTTGIFFAVLVIILLYKFIMSFVEF